MTTYQAVKTIRQWHMPHVHKGQKKFIKDMWEAVQGVGDNPLDEELKDQCGVTDKQLAYVWIIAKSFMISKNTRFEDSII